MAKQIVQYSQTNGSKLIGKIQAKHLQPLSQSCNLSPLVRPLDSSQELHLEDLGVIGIVLEPCRARPTDST